MSNKKNKIVVEYIKDSFLELIKVISNRYGEDYTFDMKVEKCIVNNYTNSYKVFLDCIYRKQDLQFSLFVIFYDEDDICALFPEKNYSIPDIVSITLVQTKPSYRYMNILQQNIQYSTIDRTILDTTTSMYNLLDKTDLANLMIEEYLLG